MSRRQRDTKLVYSTDGGKLCPQCHRPVADCVCGKDRPAYAGDGIARIRRETKGRGGKAVTVIDGLPLAPDALKQLAKQLKQRCGVGGAVKDGRIEIQGDQRELCRQTLESLGHTCKLAGG
ncbi:MAG: translation initiation factor Sui1 [Halieaceae bacterium]|jgi:translation initiation factor 1|nr:translation initiation factor Sui1 [Halieaceae bacterium]